MRRCLLPLLFGFLPPVAGAQVVRGTTSELASSAPIAGVLVTLEPASGDPALRVAVLSGAQGEYAVRARAAGRYRVSAKRIGAQRFTSEAFELATGETRRLDIRLEALAQMLPEVRVSDSEFCVRNAGEQSRVASLWDEVRTVLTAAQVSLRDRLFEGQLTKYSRGLDARTLRVLEESWADQQGLMDRPFVSLSGDSLSRVGYRRVVGDVQYYYAPDAEVLLSRAFLRDHCYGVVEGSRDRRGLIGIAFAPIPSRMVADVEGTIWLDARSYELRFVEFRYTGIEPFAGSDRVGGEVHFGKLANGAWVTSRWFVRMPQFGRSVRPVESSTRLPTVILRPTMHRLIEEGGIVFTRGLRMFERPAAVTGVVQDSAGRPFPGATVRLGGTPFSTITGDDGSFRLDSLPAGRFTLIAEHASYTGAGSYVADEAVDLREGVSASHTLRAARTSELIERLCEGRQPGRGNGVVRILVADSVTSRPLPSLRVWLRWGNRRSLGAGSAAGGFETLTDGSGAVTFCDLPADASPWFSAVRADGRPTADSVAVAITRGGLAVMRVRTARPSTP